MLEIALFDKISTMISTHSAKSDHLIDLIVMVNKFDDVTDEMIDMYQQVSKRINLPVDKIFTHHPAHRLFCHTVMQYQLKVLVPQFMKKTEYPKIQRNAVYYPIILLIIMISF